MTEEINGTKNDDKVTIDKATADKQKILAIYTVGLLVILTILVILTYLKAPISILAIGNPHIQILIFTAAAGGIGGAIYNMRVFTSRPEDIENWFIWYLLAPIGSVFFGIFSYVLVAGGVLVLSGGGPEQKELIDTTILFYCGLAFLAGFSSEQFMTKMKELADVVFQPSKPE